MQSKMSSCPGNSRSNRGRSIFTVWQSLNLVPVPKTYSWRNLVESRVVESRVQIDALNVLHSAHKTGKTGSANRTDFSEEMKTWWDRSGSRCSLGPTGCQSADVRFSTRLQWPTWSLLYTTRFPGNLQTGTWAQTQTLLMNMLVIGLSGKKKCAQATVQHEKQFWRGNQALGIWMMAFLAVLCLQNLWNSGVLKRFDLHNRAWTVACRKQRDYKIFFLSKRRRRIRQKNTINASMWCQSEVCLTGVIYISDWTLNSRGNDEIISFYFSRCFINQRNLCWALQL